MLDAPDVEGCAAAAGGGPGVEILYVEIVIKYPTYYHCHKAFDGFGELGLESVHTSNQIESNLFILKEHSRLQ